VPFVSPLTVHGELVHADDWIPPGVDVAVNVAAAAPLPEGVKDTVAWPLPGPSTALTEIGASGAARADAGVAPATIAPATIAADTSTPPARRATAPYPNITPPVSRPDS
jgi:hypothetical protein